MVTYRSLVPINTPARKAAAYEKASLLLEHAPALGVDVLRIEYMNATGYIEVDLSASISAAQAPHLGLEINP